MSRQRAQSALPTLLVAVLVLVAACADGGASSAGPDGPDCLVRLHGRSQDGAPTLLGPDFIEISPAGNGTFGFGRQWLYGSAENYREARDIVLDEVVANDCGPVVIHGHSNGGAFAARLLCDGESFGGRLIGVIIDDPVTDGITNGCQAVGDVQVALYWTGALADLLPPGTDCRTVEFECAGNLIIGIDLMADNLDVAISESPYAIHRWYRDPPEIEQWFGDLSG